MPSSDADLEWLGDLRCWRHRVSGRLLVSVTQCIGDAGLKDSTPPAPGNPYIKRGTDVHEAIEAILKGEEPVLDAVSAPYIECFARFLEEVQLEPIEVEKKRWDLALGLVGKPDIFAVFQGVRTIIDVKSGQKASWHPYQTAGYSILCAQEGGCPGRRALYLTPKRKTKPYDLEPHEDPNDVTVFLAALTVSHAQREKGRR
jgi:hypothetical protein